MAPHSGYRHKPPSGIDIIPTSAGGFRVRKYLQDGIRINHLPVRNASLRCWRQMLSRWRSGIIIIVIIELSDWVFFSNVVFQNSPSNILEFPDGCGGDEHIDNSVLEVR